MSGIAIVGASGDRGKFGNKAVRAFSKKGYKVFPVNLHEEEVEGMKAYNSLKEIPEKPDEIIFYVPPEIGIALLNEVLGAGLQSVTLPPGSESKNLIEKAKELGIKPKLTCPIQGLGINPNKL